MRPPSPHILPVCFVAFCLLLIYVFAYQKKKRWPLDVFLIYPKTINLPFVFKKSSKFQKLVEVKFFYLNLKIFSSTQKM